MEKNNLELRQRLLEENNRAILIETQYRNEAELAAKSLTMEKENLQARYNEALSQINELKSFKERFTAKMQDEMAQYKINLNKEHASILSNAEIERAKNESWFLFITKFMETETYFLSIY